MKPVYKKALIVTIALAVLILFGYGDYYLWKLLSAGAGVEAKMLCSGVFVSNRTPESVIDEDLHHRVNYISLEVDIEQQTVTATAFGFIKRRALFRKGLGSTLLAGVSEEELKSRVLPDLIPRPPNQRKLPWPTGDVLSDEGTPVSINVEHLNDALDRAFSEPDPGNKRLTRAVVIVYDGKIVAERYGSNFTKDTPLLGYGMTMSVINALAGVLVREGRLALNKPVSVPEWSAPGDPRGRITLDHLLRMSSGLEFNDSNPPLTDSVIMFGYNDMAAFAARKPLVAEPNSRFSYSNGTTAIISRLIRSAVGGSDTDYFSFPRRALFDRLGMRSAILEPDAAGTFVGSTYMYATARDWARFGLLYLQDGIWEGERILPEGWVAYSTTLTPTDPRGEYGAHFWTNSSRDKNGEQGQWPNLPGDAFFALGYDGQSLTIIPSRRLVVVRLGLTKDPKV